MNKYYLILICSICILTSCNTKNPPLQGPVKEFKQTQDQPESPVVIQFTPKVDILFVIDDSKSMENHQKNLSSNIDQFVQAIQHNSAIDTHIGVLTIWDSQRYGSVVPEFCDKETRNYYPIGHLRPLQASLGKEQTLNQFAANYITLDNPDATDVLRETLLVGAQDFIKEDPDADGPLCAKGPEYEELFTPVIAAMSENLLNSANKDFFRIEDANTEIIMVSDANDASTVTAAQLDSFLHEIKSRGQSKDRPGTTDYHVHAVSLKPGDRYDESCLPDPALRTDKKTGVVPQHKIAQIVERTGGMLLSICDRDYGSQLAELGKVIREQSMKRISYSLPHRPEEGTLCVMAIDKARVTQPGECDQAGAQIMQGRWTYDPRTVSIRFSPQFDWNQLVDKEVRVTYTPTNPLNSTSKKIGK